MLESMQSRLLVLNKETGELLAQYVESSLSQATDLFVNDIDRNVFVVTPNQVLLFPLIGSGLES